MVADAGKEGIKQVNKGIQDGVHGLTAAAQGVTNLSTMITLF